MYEVEIKAVCKNHESLIALLKEKGALFIKEQEERDVYYNHPSRDFAETDEALRIRSIEDKTQITYKGPKIGTKGKSRIEHEVSVEDMSVMTAILESLGFIAVREVKKKRTYYRYKEIDICLDFIEDLGYFAELEIMSDNVEEGEKYLFSVAAELKLEDFERKSYLELLLEKEKINAE